MKRRINKKTDENEGKRRLCLTQNRFNKNHNEREKFSTFVIFNEENPTIWWRPSREATRQADIVSVSLKKFDKCVHSLERRVLNKR